MRNLLSQWVFCLQDNQVPRRFPMLKSTLLATAMCFAFIVPASAAEQIKCDEASLTKMRSQIDAMTDKDIQKTTMGNWEAAQAAMKANNMQECNDHMADAGKSLMVGGGGDNNNNNNTGSGNGTTTTQ